MLIFLPAPAPFTALCLFLVFFRSIVMAFELVVHQVRVPPFAVAAALIVYIRVVRDIKHHCHRPHLPP